MRQQAQDNRIIHMLIQHEDNNRNQIYVRVPECIITNKSYKSQSTRSTVLYYLWNLQIFFGAYLNYMTKPCDIRHMKV